MIRVCLGGIYYGEDDPIRLDMLNPFWSVEFLLGSHHEEAQLVDWCEHHDIRAAVSYELHNEDDGGVSIDAFLDIFNDAQACQMRLRFPEFTFEVSSLDGLAFQSMACCNKSVGG